MKSVAILGSSGVVKGASFLNTADFLSSVGHNTGNLVFQYAVYNAITEPKLIVGIDIPWDPKVIRDRCRVLVLPVANFIRENFDLTGYVNFLEACNLPLVFIGLGAQADDYNKIDFNFHPSILKLIELMKGMDCRVAVRGIYTKNVLNKYGVLNSHIMGCPSNFLNKDDNLHEKLEKKWKSPVRTLSATGDEPWPKNGTKKLAEQKLISLTKEMGGVYVQQSVEPFVRILRENNPYQVESCAPELIKSLNLSIAPGMDESQFRKFLTSSVRLYISVDQWLEEMSKFDLSIGLRLHGNMVPFQSGCPAIWITHDSRTSELVETMALPNLSLEKFLELKSLEDMKECCNFNFNDYYLKRKALSIQYKSVLDYYDIKNDIN